MRVVIDTNVLVSGLINPIGNPAAILNLVLNQKIMMLYDNRILDEYNRVLLRDKFGFSKELINPLLDFIKASGEFIAATPLNIQFKDEEDKKFFEVAVSGKADYLITGNRNHFPKKKLVITPIKFIKNYIKPKSL